MKKTTAGDFLVYDKSSNSYRADPEQVVRDDVEKNYWKNVVRTVVKDWRLYIMLIPMILVFLFWRYFPMYELLRCFKVSDQVKPVSEQFFSGFSYLSGCCSAETACPPNSGGPCAILSC